MSRRKREREAPEVGAMAGRVVRALVRRAGEGDTEALEQLLSLQAQIAAAVNDAGAGLHAFGYSFTELADVAGVSRQAARQRFGRPDEPAGELATAARQLATAARRILDTPATSEMPELAGAPLHTSPMGLAQ